MRCETSVTCGHRVARPEAGFAGREARGGLTMRVAEEGGSWGKHGFPHVSQPRSRASVGA
jgi:hypothetical protein